ncbi:MAG: ABC transporter permease [Anaerolineae bacterium]|nr:ABC transporter permease [Anaerolineae bacterium]
MGFKIERIPAPLWARPLIPIAAILITFLLTATLILLVNTNPLDAYYYFLVDPLSSRVSAIEVLVKATPLLLTGAAVTFAFVGGYWNIGVEGQLYAGATAATAIGVQMQNVSPWIAIPLMISGGFVAGMLWALIPALMKVKLAIDEVVTTLLLNSVALFMVSALLNGPWRNPISQWPQSPDIAAAAIFPKLIPRSRLHLGFILALVVIVILWFVLTKTAFGLKMRAVGLSPHAAQFAGINVQQTMLISALVSGGIGGVAGVSEIAGIHYHLIDAISPGYGYTGIIIATLGTLNAWGVALAALFIVA